MTNEELLGLLPGDIVTRRGGQEYLVVGQYADHVTVIPTIKVGTPDKWPHPDEWALARHVSPGDVAISANGLVSPICGPVEDK